MWEVLIVQLNSATIGNILCGTVLPDAAEPIFSFWVLRIKKKKQKKKKKNYLSNKLQLCERVLIMGMSEKDVIDF